MICASIDSQGFVLSASTQPADMSACSVVLVTGAELGSLTAFAVPTPSQFAAAWGWGFSLVVGTYVIAWGIGSVLRFLSQRN